MKLINILTVFAVTLQLGAALPLTVTNELESIGIEARDLEALDTIFKRSDDLDDFLAKRDVAVVTDFFTALNKSGLVPPTLKILATNKITEPLLVKAIIAFLKTQNFEDLLESIDESGLGVDLFIQALKYQAFLPGLYNIINGMMTGAATTVSSSSVDSSQLQSNIQQISSLYDSSNVGSALTNLLDQVGVTVTDAGSGLLSLVNSLVGGLLSNILGGGSSSSSSSDSSSGSSSVSVTSTASTSTATTATTSGSSSGSSSGNSGSSASSTSSTTSTTSSTSSSSSSSSGSSRLKGILSSLASLLGFKKRDLEQLDEIEELIKRENAVLNSLMESLEKSGLAMQVIWECVTDPSMAPFVRNLIVAIVQDKVLSISELSLALQGSNAINDIIVNTIISSKLGITIPSS